MGWKLKHAEYSSVEAYARKHGIPTTEVLFLASRQEIDIGFLNEKECRAKTGIIEYEEGIGYYLCQEPEYEDAMCAEPILTIPANSPIYIYYSHISELINHGGTTVRFIKFDIAPYSSEDGLEYQTTFAELIEPVKIQAGGLMVITQKARLIKKIEKEATKDEKPKQGKPSKGHEVIMQELRRRGEAGLLKSNVTDEANHLHNWYEDLLNKMGEDIKKKLPKSDTILGNISKDFYKYHESIKQTEPLKAHKKNENTEE